MSVMPTLTYPHSYQTQFLDLTPFADKSQPILPYEGPELGRSWTYVFGQFLLTRTSVCSTHIPFLPVFGRWLFSFFLLHPFQHWGHFELFFGNIQVKSEIFASVQTTPSLADVSAHLLQRPSFPIWQFLISLPLPMHGQISPPCTCIF